MAKSSRVRHAPARTSVVAHVSVLMRGRSGAFTVERLMQFLTALGQDVQVTVRSTRKRQGERSVVVR